MLVLGIDTALQSCSVAILRDGEGGGDNYTRLPSRQARGQAEILPPMVAKTLVEAGIAISDLDRIGVVVGPGGFAGVRVGLAFARGLALGTGIEIVGVTSLAALASGARSHAREFTAAIIDARRDQVYAALYDRNGAAVIAPFVSEPKAAMSAIADRTGQSPVELVGDGADLLGAAPRSWAHAGAAGHIDAKNVALLAALAPHPSGPPAPLYLRAPDAKPAQPSLFAGLAKS